MKKKDNKKEKLTESLHFMTVEMTGSSNYKSHKHKQNHRRNLNAALNEKPTDPPHWFIIRSLT